MMKKNNKLTDGQRAVEIRILTKAKKEATFKETILTVLVDDAEYDIDVKHRIIPKLDM